MPASTSRSSLWRSTTESVKSCVPRPSFVGLPPGRTISRKTALKFGSCVKQTIIVLLMILGSLLSRRSEELLLLLFVVVVVLSVDDEFISLLLLELLEGRLFSLFE